MAKKNSDLDQPKNETLIAKEAKSDQTSNR